MPRLTFEDRSSAWGPGPRNPLMTGICEEYLFTLQYKPTYVTGILDEQCQKFIFSDRPSTPFSRARVV